MIGKHLIDQFVIYYSKQDKMWIAHSMETDNIGVSADAGEAFIDAACAVETIIDFAKKEKSLNVLRKAPKNVKDKFYRAVPVCESVSHVLIDMADAHYKGIKRDYSVSFKPKNKNLIFVIPVEYNVTDVENLQ